MTNSTSTSRKPTKAQMFTAMLEKYDFTPAEVDFIKHELELLAKKNTTKDGAKRLTQTQKDNIVLSEEIVSYMEADHLYTCGEIIKLVPSCNELSTPKVSALMRLLVDNCTVVRVEDKRKTYFKLA